MKPGNPAPGVAASGKEEKNKIITKVEEATLRAVPKITATRKISKRDTEDRTEKYNK